MDQPLWLEEFNKVTEDLPLFGEIDLRLEEEVSVRPGFETVVYKAVTLVKKGVGLPSGTTVGLKLFKDGLNRTGQEVKAFLSEVLNLKHARSQCHRICMLHGIYRDKKDVGIVMDYYDGGTLKDKIGGQPLPWLDFCSVGLAVADALNGLHHEKILMRDIKPENIMFKLGASEPFIIDLGLSSRLQAQDTSRVSVAGTHFYMAPEAWKGVKDLRSDIYGFGCILIEMATGWPPFHGFQQRQVKYRVGRRGELPEVPQDIYTETEEGDRDTVLQLIERCLQREPTERPSLDEIVKAFTPLRAKAFLHSSSSKRLKAFPPSLGSSEGGKYETGFSPTTLGVEGSSSSVSEATDPHSTSSINTTSTQSTFSHELQFGSGPSSPKGLAEAPCQQTPSTIGQVSPLSPLDPGTPFGAIEGSRYQDEGKAAASVGALGCGKPAETDAERQAGRSSGERISTELNQTLSSTALEQTPHRRGQGTRAPATRGAEACAESFTWRGTRSWGFCRRACCTEAVRQHQVILVEGGRVQG
ncbi:Protein kinase superfamily protein [Klebsormidium nitens]|uniref:Protein kinase superfamily protein n=1 Tax=Klebsormidium nitens TaxID=105231 RepID=A0A1Y1IUT3_KLENI|nr:Protein kinase superfamily protein [Klebsormidium nitens]|eukprot:GAQ91998.1 Protein kinase superfamily protein [Klebsormidium nitens]